MGLTNLINLNVRLCSIGPQGLLALLQNNHHLQVLNISYANTNLRVWQCITSLKKLTKLPCRGIIRSLPTVGDGPGRTGDMGGNFSIRRPSVTSVIYPNPFNEQLTIEYVLASDSPVSLQIINAMGQIVVASQSEMLQSAGKFRETVATERLPNGLYFLILKTTDGEQRFKITK